MWLSTRQGMCPSLTQPTTAFGESTSSERSPQWPACRLSRLYADLPRTRSICTACSQSRHCQRQGRSGHSSEARFRPWQSGTWCGLAPSQVRDYWSSSRPYRAGFSSATRGLHRPDPSGVGGSGRQTHGSVTSGSGRGRYPGRRSAGRSRAGAGNGAGGSGQRTCRC